MFGQAGPSAPLESESSIRITWTVRASEAIPRTTPSFLSRVMHFRLTQICFWLTQPRIGAAVLTRSGPRRLFRSGNIPAEIEGGAHREPDSPAAIPQHIAE